MTGSLRKAVFFALVMSLTIIGYQFMIKPANKDLAAAKARVDMKLIKLGEYEKATAAAEGLTRPSLFSRAGFLRRARFMKFSSRLL